MILDYDPVVDSVVVVREHQQGDVATIAVEFEHRDGRRRRGMLGADRREDGIWRPSGAFGGWVADPAGVSVRLVDVRTDEVLLEDRVRDGVVIFITDGGLPTKYARADLVDEGGDVLRSQRLLRSRQDS